MSPCASRADAAASRPGRRSGRCGRPRPAPTAGRPAAVGPRPGPASPRRPGTGKKSDRRPRNSLQVRVLDGDVDLQLRRQSRPLLRILRRRSGQKLQHDRVLRRQVDGAEHARQGAAFETIVQPVIPVQERPGASGHQHHRLVSRQHAARNQPFGERPGVALRQAPLRLAKTGHQLLALLGGDQAAVRQQLPELRNGCRHIASLPPRGGDSWSRRQAGSSRVQNGSDRTDLSTGYPLRELGSVTPREAKGRNAWIQFCSEIFPYRSDASACGKLLSAVR